MRGIWSRVDQQLERWLITLFYGYFCLIIVVEVVRRYVFGSSSNWGEMTARYAFVYLVYIAAAEVAKSNDHIRIDVVPRLLGPRGRLLLYAYFDLIYLILAGLVIYYSLEVMQLSVATDTLMTGFDLNMAFAQAALPIGWALLAYRVIQRFLRSVRSFRQHREVPLGGGGFGNCSDLVVLVIGLLMLVHLAIGLPLFVVLGVGSLAMVSIVGVYSPTVLGQVPFTAIDNWALLAMPLFILTGDIIATGRIAQQLVRLGQATVGWITGGLGMATIMGCFFFAGTSGSNSADTAAIGKIMISSMVKHGYTKPYAAALAASGGCLGIIVPPSLIFIIYGVITSTSVGDLFLGGVCRVCSWRP